MYDHVLVAFMLIKFKLNALSVSLRLFSVYQFKISSLQLFLVCCCLPCIVHLNIKIHISY